MSQAVFCGWPEGTLPALLEPFLSVHQIDLIPASPGWDIVRISATAKGPETVGDTGADLDRLIGGGQQRLIDGLARSTREVMFKQVEDAIAAALEAGWALASHPEIEITGTVRHDRETGVDVPCAECRATLVFRRPVS